MRPHVTRLTANPGARSARFLLMLSAAAFGLTLASIAHAGSGLAPPGPCAEPREALAGGGSASVVGPLAQFFNPAGVAAALVSPRRAAPSANAVVRPGSCDNPGAGCGILPTRSKPSIVGGTPPEPPKKSWEVKWPKRRASQ